MVATFMVPFLSESQPANPIEQCRLRLGLLHGPSFRPNRPARHRNCPDHRLSTLIDDSVANGNLHNAPPLSSFPCPGRQRKTPAEPGRGAHAVHAETGQPLVLPMWLLELPASNVDPFTRTMCGECSAGSRRNRATRHRWTRLRVRSRSLTQSASRVNGDLRPEVQGSARRGAAKLVRSWYERQPRYPFP
jgi:hypothetical protein